MSRSFFKKIARFVISYWVVVQKSFWAGFETFKCTL